MIYSDKIQRREEERINKRSQPLQQGTRSAVRNKLLEGDQMKSAHRMDSKKKLVKRKNLLSIIPPKIPDDLDAIKISCAVQLAKTKITINVLDKLTYITRTPKLSHKICHIGYNSLSRVGGAVQTTTYIVDGGGGGVQENIWYQWDHRYHQDISSW